MGWTYELNPRSETFFGDVYDTKEECISEAKKEAIGEGLTEFRIGETYDIDTGIDTCDLLERIGERVYDEIGDIAEDYLVDVKNEEREELEAELNKVFDKWKKKYNYEPNFYGVENIETIKIK